jgi:hypothetical protein
MFKITETTELSENVTSFEIDRTKVNVNESLKEMYERYQGEISETEELEKTAHS